MTVETLVAAVLVVGGIVGVLVPVLPGLLLVLAGVAVWAVPRGDAVGWSTLAVVAAIVVVGSVVKYLLPGRRLRDAGVPTSTMLVGAALGIVGFFVIPVVGLFLGFVLGIFAAEYLRLGDRALAWPSTRSALAAVGWSMAIELLTALLGAAVWVGALLLF